MVDRGHRPYGRPDHLNVGILIIVGFAGSPNRISDAVLSSEHVENLSIKRSGTQLELTISLSHPPVTTKRLLELVQRLSEYDVKTQGEIMAPVPTLVVSLTPARTRSSKFSLRKSTVGSVQRNLSRTERPGATLANEIGVTSAAGAVPARHSTRTQSRVPERDANEQPGPVAVFSKRLGQFVARSVAAGLLGAASIIGRSMRYSAIFAHLHTAQLAVQVRRALSRWFAATVIIISRISIVITLIGNGVFGSGIDDDSETGSSESTDSESDKNLRD